MIVYHPARPVKSARRNRPFGMGLGRNQSERLPIGPSAADRAWSAYHLNVADDSAEDRHFDELAQQSEWQDRIEAGFTGC